MLTSPVNVGEIRLAARLDSTAVTLAVVVFKLAFKRVNVTKSLEAATNVLAAILACSAVSSQ